MDRDLLSLDVERTMIVAVSPAIDEARDLIRELDTEIAALYPGLPINGIDVAE